MKDEGEMKILLSSVVDLIGLIATNFTTKNTNVPH